MALSYESAGVNYGPLDAFKRACQRAAKATAGLLGGHGYGEPAGEPADLVIGPEHRAEFDEMLAAFRDEIEPLGPLEHTLFDQLVSAAWNLRRIRRMETELCAAAQSFTELLNDDQLQKKLDRLARHHTRIERCFHRCLKELKTLQTNAVIQSSLPAPLRKNVPPLSSANEIAKRTQYLEAHDPIVARSFLKRFSDIPPLEAAIKPDLHLTANAT